VKVSTGIPIPDNVNETRARKYPFNTLDVNGSVEFDDTEEFERARRAAQSYGRTHGWVFTSRKGIQNGKFVGNGGTIWRKS
jgi:hypothetical protein